MLVRNQELQLSFFIETARILLRVTGDSSCNLHLVPSLHQCEVGNIDSGSHRPKLCMCRWKAYAWDEAIKKLIPVFESQCKSITQSSYSKVPEIVITGKTRAV